MIHRRFRLSTLANHFQAGFDLSPSLGAEARAPLGLVPPPRSTYTFIVLRGATKSSQASKVAGPSVILRITTGIWSIGHRRVVCYPGSREPRTSTPPHAISAQSLSAFIFRYTFTGAKSHCRGSSPSTKTSRAGFACILSVGG
jgi:hypothetical protein